ncbi:MAG: hypothetical protein R2856_22030 [Caldilineaceae bacterium]
MCGWCACPKTTAGGAGKQRIRRRDPAPGINADDAIVVPYAGAANGELVLRFRNLPTLRVSLKSQPGMS